jgi:hypothetical protein
MKTIFKYAVAATLVGALALAVASPSEARGGRNAAAIGGFVAGALIGSAVVNGGYYGGPGYYGGSGYYGPAYGYAPGYYAQPGYGYEDSYAYEPAPVYSGRRYYRSNGNCDSSPGSMNSGVGC